MNFSEYKDSRKDKTLISFEVFPPKDDLEFERLKGTLSELAGFDPEAITVTHGAMGKGSRKTVKTASYIKNTLNTESACHLTCIRYSKDQIDAVLEEIRMNRINNIVALRGDTPQNNAEDRESPGDFRHANELVEHIRRNEQRKPHRFSVAVAGYPEKHPESPSFKDDIENLKKKVDAGADVIITQLFFDNRLYFNYVDMVRTAGIDVPVIAGLMPIISSKQVLKISSLCGSSIPSELRKELENAGDNNAKAAEIGVAQCTQQTRELVDKGVDGLHFYVLNRTSNIEKILNSL